MEDPFEGVSEAKEDEMGEDNKIRSLTDSFVFCPRCGKKNSFTDSSLSSQHFCVRCSTRLSDLWKKQQKGEMVIINCQVCNQLTFRELKYCVSCGERKTRIFTKTTEGQLEKKAKFSGVPKKKKVQVYCALLMTTAGFLLVLYGGVYFIFAESHSTRELLGLIIGVFLLIFGGIYLLILFLDIRKYKI